MILPIGDSPDLAKRPWVTWSLMVLNIGTFFAVLLFTRGAADPSDPLYREYFATMGHVPQGQLALFMFDHGFRPSAPSLIDAFTSMFLHAGFAHLFGNMLFLWIYGDNVEHRLGRFNFLAAYLLTGLLGAGGDAILRWGSGVPAIGASGAISGVLGLYFIFFPKNVVRVLFFIVFIIQIVELPARWVLGFYLVVQNLLPLLVQSISGAGDGGGGVSFGAHIGGFAAGVGLALLASARFGTISRSRRSVAPDRNALRGALNRGDIVSALEIYASERRSDRRAHSIEEKLDLATQLEERRQDRAALSIYQRCIADHPRSEHLSRAHRGAARAMMKLLSPAAAYQHAYQALELARTEKDRSAARQLLDQMRTKSRRFPNAN